MDQCIPNHISRFKRKIPPNIFQILIAWKVSSAAAVRMESQQLFQDNSETQNMFKHPQKLLKLLLQHSALFCCWSVYSFLMSFFSLPSKRARRFNTLHQRISKIFDLRYLSCLSPLRCLYISHNTLDYKQKCTEY